MKVVQKTTAAELTEPDNTVLDGIYLVTLTAQWRQGGVARGDERRTLKTRPCARIADAVVATTDPRHFDVAAKAPIYRSVTNGARLVRYGGDCYCYAMLAMGLAPQLRSITCADGYVVRYRTWSSGQAPRATLVRSNPASFTQLLTYPFTQSSGRTRRFSRISMINPIMEERTHAPLRHSSRLQV